MRITEGLRKRKEKPIRVRGNSAIIVSRLLSEDSQKIQILNEVSPDLITKLVDSTINFDNHIKIIEILRLIFSMGMIVTAIVLLSLDNSSGWIFGLSGAGSSVLELVKHFIDR